MTGTAPSIRRFSASAANDACPRSRSEAVGDVSIHPSQAWTGDSVPCPAGLAHVASTGQDQAQAEMIDTMTKYLISFPSAAMVVADDDWDAVVRDSHAVIEEAKVAGVYVFGGGIDESVPLVRVSASGAVAEGGYPWGPALNGGFTVLELPSRDAAVEWAARIAKACRCDQELRVFGYDPQS